MEALGILLDPFYHGIIDQGEKFLKMFGCVIE